ncbi:hypothetical protein SAMN05216351_10732 [Pseudobutyrivibrio sp. JW11]|uniref:DUF2304 domain-containing protein n=1 Tax=Pseudobutyrivibrio sp. JW11 TaxID=1855302 RepID=UPI0008E00D1D|nr:DUF2304 domain-containing protein [Pseudobutyrivibrio sp. JW11]SFO34982.1 hypothetical protein SAMN05216351_10732 [Pseudobutyrivibrio sp. JW11]
METTRIKVFIFIVLVIALIGILRFIQKKELQLKYALIWILVDVLMIVAVLFPRFLMFISNLIGVYSLTNTLFFLGIMFILAIVFSLTVALSRASERIRKLSQQIALNEYDKNEVNDEN